MPALVSRNPFVGPRPIQQGEPLHGRSVEVRELYNQLQARRIVVLHSPSGAGKSSLVQAGLMPRLAEEGFDVWNPVRVNLDPQELQGIPPGTNRYRLSAMVSLEDELPEAHRRPPPQLASLDLLDYLESRPRRKRRKGRPVVLLFDQFEEVLTVAPRDVDAKHAFFASVGRALDTDRYWALFIIREDYLAAFAPYRDRIPTQMSNTFRLDLLGLAGGREAAVNLAREGGRTFPSVDRLIHDLSTVKVQQPDGTFVEEQGIHVEPVHLQVVCRRLWEAMPEDDPSIDEEDIEAYAGVSEALAGYYADAIQQIAGGEASVERAIRDWVGTQLIVGGIRSQVRREPSRSAGLDNALIDQLVGRYLVRTEQRAGANWFELGHDRLVEPIQQDNEAWERDNLHALQVQAKLWENGRRARALLLGAEALPDALGWAQDNAGRLTETEREFLEQSRALRAEEARRRRIRRTLTTVATVTAVLSAVLAVYAYRERGKAQVAAHEANEARENAERARELADESAHDAREAEDLARRQRDRARAASWTAYVRTFKSTDPTHALLGLRDMPNKGTVGWVQDVLDVMQQQRALAVLEGAITAASFSPDGTRVVTGSEDGAVWVRSADGRGTSRRLSGHEGKITTAVYSPDGRRIATTSWDGTAKIWPADGQGSPIELPHGAKVNSAHWSADGGRLVTTATDRTVHVYILGASKENFLFDLPKPVLSARLSPDGRSVLVRLIGEPLWLEMKTGRQRSLGGQTTVYAAEFSPDGSRIVTASQDGTALVWSVGDEGPPVALVGHRGPVRSASFSPDGQRVLTASKDGTARVWSATGEGEPLVFEGHQAPVWEASFSDDGRRIVTASEDGTARVWSADGSGEAVLLPGHEASVWGASFDAGGGRVLTVSDDQTARVWDIDPSTELLALEGHINEVVSASFSPDGRRILTAAADEAIVWSADEGEQLHALQLPDDITSASFSPDGTRVAMGSSNASAYVKSADGSGEPLVFTGHAREITSVGFSPDGRRLLTASKDKTARIWPMDGGAEPTILTGHTDQVLGASFSPDGTRVATASRDYEARIWPAAGGEATDTVRHAFDVTAAAFSPDGSRIVTASKDGTARVWSLGDGQPPIVLAGHDDFVLSAAFSPDGSRIVTASKDGTARVWAASGDTEPLVLRGTAPSPALALYTASFSPDGTRIITGSNDHRARVWLIDPPQLQAWLEAASTACVPREDRIRVLGETEAEACLAHAECERHYGRPADEC